MKEKKQKDDWDDGRVIAPMTGEELPPYRRIGLPKRDPDAKKEKKKSDISKKENRAMIRAMFAVMLPRLCVVLLGFGLVFALMYLWLGQ